MKNTLQHNTQQNIINLAIHQKSYLKWGWGWDASHQLGVGALN